MKRKYIMANLQAVSDQQDPQGPTSKALFNQHAVRVVYFGSDEVQSTETGDIFAGTDAEVRTAKTKLHVEPTELSAIRNLPEVQATAVR